MRAVPIFPTAHREILNADIQFYNNVMNLARDWYFVQVGPLDRVRQDSLCRTT